ncbi:MAG TPA: pseudomurein-binding repeat-containing protein, partial [Methanobacterium sp.]|nr:pseudomurein-binding repeat-containing protein [Methanobacterium sp.]
MHCPKCGANNDSDAKYCEKCGTPLNGSPKVTEENTSPAVKYLIVICVILVAGLGIAAGYIFQGHPTASNSNQVQSNVISQSTGFPLSETPNLAVQISKANGNIASVQYHGVTLDKNQCLYILSKAIVMFNSGETGNIPIDTYGDANEPGGYLSHAYITKSEYVDMADRTYKWMDSNGRSPNHTGIDYSGSPDLSPDTTLK